MKHPLLQAVISDWIGKDIKAPEDGLTAFRQLDEAALDVLRELATQIHSLSECVVLDRFVFFSTEANLELAARRLIETGDMLAGEVGPL